MLHTVSEFACETFTGAVKWFDPAKGYGFIALNDGSGRDILVHISTLQGFGRDSLPQNATVTCETTQRPGGLQAIRIVDVDISTATTAERVKAQPVLPESGWKPATVKWFSRAKGFGFLNVEGVEQDIFVHMETLRQGDIRELRTGETIEVNYGHGPKGLMAAAVRLTTPDQAA